jgi:hypothetical protein
MHFDTHRGLSQLEESKHMWTHYKDGAMWQFWVKKLGKEQEEGRSKGDGEKIEWKLYEDRWVQDDGGWCDLYWGVGYEIHIQYIPTGIKI